MTFDVEAVRECLAAVYDLEAGGNPGTSDDSRRWEFVFHMTDWLKDMERLHGLFAEPCTSREKERLDEAHDVVAGFLLHAWPHLTAAYELLLDQAPEPVFAVHGPDVRAEE